MRERVALETQGKVPTSDIAAALVAAGASNLCIDPRAGDSGASVEQYYFFEFDDSRDGGKHRVGFAFHCFPSSEAEKGWTRFELGADDRAHDLVSAIGQSVGGWLKDDRSGKTMTYDTPGTEYAPRMMAA